MSVADRVLTALRAHPGAEMGIVDVMRAAGLSAVQSGAATVALYELEAEGHITARWGEPFGEPPLRRRLFKAATA